MTERARKRIAEVIKEKGDFNVSNSKINTYRRCKYAYHLRYVDKLRRKVKKRPLQFGTMIHEMLEADAEGKDPFELLEEMRQKQGKLFRTMIEEYGDIVEDVRVIMTEYFEFWDEKSLRFVRKNGKKAEHRFRVEISPGIFLVGKIDGIGQTPNKLRWLIEHKSFTQMPNEDHRWRNLQSSIYIRVNEMLGWQPVDGTCWDYIWSKTPGKPERTSTGKMSRRAINTLPTRVIETLEAEGEKPRNFPELIKLAEENRSSYFKRIFNPVKKRVVDALWAEMLETSLEMRENTSRVKTIDRHCDWCDYEGLCRAELQGSDVAFIREREYYVDQEDHSEEWADAATEV